MTDNQPLSSDSDRRVLRFRRGPTGRRAAASPPAVNNLAKFERGPEADDYRHRMIVNTVAFLFVVAGIGAGLWLAETMASLRRNKDCVLAGHRNCASISEIK